MLGWLFAKAYQFYLDYLIASYSYTPIERKRPIGCPLSFVRRPLLSNKNRDYISTTGEI
jgi:hypothetical protein